MGLWPFLDPSHISASTAGQIVNKNENSPKTQSTKNVSTFFQRKMSIGVPIKVLHEAEGHIITCETITGEVYRGKLIEAEDNMNCQMTAVTVTYRDGRVAQLENIYIRGSKIRYFTH